MTHLPPGGMQRREFAILSARAFIVGGGGSVALLGCGKGPTTATVVASYRVAGPSMNPTLWDTSQMIQCVNCGLATRVDEGLLRLAIEHLSISQPTTRVVCWHCGAPLLLSQLRDSLSGPGLPPDQVNLQACDPDELTIGDVVVFENHGVQIKRVLAGPGQTVSLDEDVRLLIDDQRPAFKDLPQVAVDIDQHREPSRWRAAIVPSNWKRDRDRSWIATGDSQWLIYEHRSVYRGDSPLRVLDDYPGNIGVQRDLYPADGLSVQFQLSATAQQTPFDVIVWTAFCSAGELRFQRKMMTSDQQGCLVAMSQHSLSHPINEYDIVNADQEELLQANVELTGLLLPQHPLGIRIVAADGCMVRVRDLRVYRDVVYRIATRSTLPKRRVDAPRFPLILQKNQWFLVGDNVPLSIDSRHWGVIENPQLIGRVAPERR